MPQGRVVLVTGSAGAIGAAFVERFLANGDTLIATDIADEPLEQLRMSHPDARLITISGDISQEKDCGRIMDVAREAAGRLDVLINCAGHYPIKAFEEMLAEDWRRVIDINLTSNFLMTRAALPLMKGRGWGRIINFGSASVYEGVPGQAHYVAAKAGIIGLSRSLAREFGGHGITVNVVAPGLTITPPVQRTFTSEILQKAREMRAIKRDEEAADLVGVAFFLASPDADFITGQTLTVDGGSHMN